MSIDANALNQAVQQFLQSDQEVSESAAQIAADQTAHAKKVQAREVKKQAVVALLGA